MMFKSQPGLILACLRLILIFIMLGLAGNGMSGQNCFAGSVSNSDPNDEFAIQTWNTEHGMPENIVTALLQTKKGFIWSGSYNGIAQFDGEHFRVFDSSHTPGLANSRVSSLYEDDNGTIWIGHDTANLTCYSNGKFEPIAIKAAWTGGRIAGIQPDRAGDIWIVNLRGEAVRIRDGLLVKPPAEMEEDLSLVPQLLLDNDESLLLVRNGYVAEIKPTGCHMVSFDGSVSRPYYSRVAASLHGGLWVLDAHVRRWYDGQWREDLGENPWSNASVTTAFETTSGRLLVGTLERGLFIYDSRLGWMNLNRSNGLPQDWVRCLAEDTENNVWVGTSGGLVVLRPRSVVMRNPPDNWQGRSVQGIMETRDGSIWAATEGSGVYQFKDGIWKNYAYSSGLANLFAWTVLQDSSDRIWVGTWGGGLFQLSGTNFIKKFEASEGGEPITSMLESPPGTIWFGTVAGLMRCSGDKLEQLTGAGGAAAGDVRALAAGTGGAIWFGTTGKGLGHYKNGKVRSLGKADGLPSDFILSLYEENEARLWIGTLDQGICLYENGNFYSVTTEQGLPNNNIAHIEDDGLGHFWFGSQRGLFRVDKNELIFCAHGKIPRIRALVFGKAEGLATLAGSSGFTPAGFRAADGRLWFPTAQGLAVVNPKSVRRNLIPPQVWIENVLVDGQPAEIRKPDNSENIRRGVTKVVELKTGRRQLEVSFTGLSFTSPDRVEFKYKLEGLDTDWTECGTRRRVTYPFLPFGHYTFRVAACNNDGLWNNTGDALNLIVPPLIWQTSWFKAACAIGCLGIVGGGVNLQSRRRHRRKLERISRERELERERARIAQDIHDDLGASLTRIGMLSESATEDLNDKQRAAASLGQIHSTARDLTRAMDEIVWAVNPRHDTLESLTNYITRFAHDFLSAAHIRCRLDAPMGMPELIVRSEIRHNLFLAFKEALNNAVKHSGATEVRVLFQFNPTSISLIVADNGSGFDLQTPALPKGNRLVSGYGINGIRERLEQVGGKMEIQSRKGAGTSVIFTLLIRDIIRSESAV